jgi:hypothetical protein
MNEFSRKMGNLSKIYSPKNNQKDYEFFLSICGCVKMEDLVGINERKVEDLVGINKRKVEDLVGINKRKVEDLVGINERL